jgi:thymidylate synthase (FAD)
MKKNNNIELCDRCKNPAHPNIPCEEVIEMVAHHEGKLVIKEDEDEDLPLLTNRHYDMAHKALGEVHRFKHPDGGECGWVEVQNAVKTLAFLYADLEHATHHRPLARGFTIPVLDHGFVRYIDHMGSDERICEAARISYKSPSKGIEQDEKLIAYLWKNKHTSPFEMAKVTLNIKLPIFVMRQYVRHRMQNLNEMSARYTELPNEFYIPKQWRKQDTKNKQGSQMEENWDDKSYYKGILSKNEDLSAELENHSKACYELYQDMLKDGVAREMARMVLPVNIYTEIYACWDMKNLLHFITLRDDSHAQAEIQQYGKAIKSICKTLFPLTMEAYEKYKWKIIETPE